VVTGIGLEKLGARYKLKLERADLKTKPEEYALGVVGGSIFLWLGLSFVFHPGFMIVGVMFVPCIAAGFFLGDKFLGFKIGRRVGTFTAQLEMILRMMAGALRVGLGLRQAMILVTEEVPDPARREFMRVVGRTNLGISILDALDELAVTVPSHEIEMTVRAIRVQSQTGGDLAKVLDSLASTIKERRKMIRKVGALTAQGRAGAWIIGALPVGIGGFVLGTQPEMSHALLGTFIGHIMLGLVVVLEGLAAFSLSKILNFNV